MNPRCVINVQYVLGKKMDKKVNRKLESRKRKVSYILYGRDICEIDVRDKCEKFIPATRGSLR